jgi:hypothetical protein
MTIAEIVAAVAPEKQGPVAAELAKYAEASVIDSREAASIVLKGNKHIQAEVASIMSKQADELRERLRADELPKLLAAEREKLEAEYRPKPKDPELAAALERFEKSEKARLDMESKYRREALLGRVAPKFAEAGIDAKYAARFIGNDEAETDAQAEEFIKAIQKSRDDYANKVIKDTWPGMQPPKTGETATTREQLAAQYDALIKAGKREEANRIFIAMSRMKE